MKKPPLEKFLVNKVIDLIISRGGFAVKIWGNPTQEKGIPDVLACYRGQFLGLETKRPGNEPSPYQAYQLGRIARAGGVALTIHTVEQVEELLNRIDGDNTPQS